MNKKVYTDNFSKKLIESAEWEYSDNSISILKKNKKDDFAYSYTLKVNNKTEKFDVIINLNLDKSKITGFCNCVDSVKEGTCKHMVMACMTIEKDMALEKKEVAKIKTDVYKLDLLKKIYKPTLRHDLISINLMINEISSEGIKLGLKINIFGHKPYVVKSINTLITDIDNNKLLAHGKEFQTHNYIVDDLSSKLFSALKVLIYDLEKSSLNINRDYITYKQFNTLLISKINQELYLNDEIFLIKDRLDDIVLNVESLDDGAYNLKLRRSSFFEKLGSDLVINRANKVIYSLKFEQMQKINLLDSFLETNRDFLISSENSEEFMSEVLPNIYNEFSVKLDNKMDYKLIDESFSSNLYCYLEDRVIHIKINFLYGEYDVSKSYKNTLIKRNYSKENQVMQILINQGYVFDHQLNEFLISANRSQFNFLTKSIFLLKQEFEVYLDEKLQSSILNYDSSTIKIDIKQSEGLDYFDINFDIGDIEISEIQDIIASFDAKKDYHHLNNEAFLKLNDSKLLFQLLFLKDVIGDNSHTMNTYRVPKYKSFLVKKQASKLFVNVTANQEFEDYIDQITLIEDVDYDLEEACEFHLRPYQKTGVNWLNGLYKANLGALLADEMGLGKTLQLISFLRLNSIKNALIVMPKALLYNWKAEFLKFDPNQKVVILDGSRKEREVLSKTLTGHEIVLISYNTLINDHDLFDNHTFEVMVIDEAQYIKNAQTKTTRTTKKVQANFYVALTGTPIENNLLELWSIFDYIIPGYLNDSKSFIKQYINSSDRKQKENLREIIKPFILRRYKTKVLNELPDKIIVDVMCAMDTRQKAIYASYVESLNLSDIHSLKQMEVLAAITRLRQIAIDPAIMYEDYLDDSAKMIQFDEIINQIVASEKKVIVFSQYTTVLKKLKARLEKNNIKNYYLDGETKPKQRMMDVEKFNKNKIPVYLVSLKAGGVGLNLTSASNVIVFDPWWNPAVEAQAVDRAHRIGQKDVVSVYRFITTGTIEEKINKMNEIKLKVADEMLNDDINLISKLSSEELKKLLV